MGRPTADVLVNRPGVRVLAGELGDREADAQYPDTAQQHGQRSCPSGALTPAPAMSGVR